MERTWRLRDHADDEAYLTAVDWAWDATAEPADEEEGSAWRDPVIQRALERARRDKR